MASFLCVFVGKNVLSVAHLRHVTCCVVQKVFVIFIFSERHVEEVVKLIKSVLATFV